MRSGREVLPRPTSARHESRKRCAPPWCSFSTVDPTVRQLAPRSPASSSARHAPHRASPRRRSAPRRSWRRRTAPVESAADVVAATRRVRRTVLRLAPLPARSLPGVDRLAKQRPAVGPSGVTSRRERAHGPALAPTATCARVQSSDAMARATARWQRAPRPARRPSGRRPRARRRELPSPTRRIRVKASLTASRGLETGRAAAHRGSASPRPSGRLRRERGGDPAAARSASRRSVAGVWRGRQLLPCGTVRRRRTRESGAELARAARAPRHAARGRARSERSAGFRDMCRPADAGRRPAP